MRSHSESSGIGNTQSGDSKVGARRQEKGGHREGERR